jgi:hypothetical protein
LIQQRADTEQRVGRPQITLQKAGGEDGRTWCAAERLSIGRLTSCDVVLDNASISRRHAEIVHGDGGWVIRDLGSTNGTLLNGVRLGGAPQRLRLGDHVQPGRVLLTVTALDDSAGAGSTFFDRLEQRAVDTAAVPNGTATVECAAFDADAPPTEKPSRIPRVEPGASDPLRDFLASSLRGAVHTLGAQSAGVFLSEPDTGQLLLKASCCAAATDRGAEYDHRLIQRCFQDASTLLIANTRAANLPAPVKDAPRSVLGIPLVAPSQQLGVLWLQRPAARPFTDRDQLLGQAVAHTMAAGIASARQMLEQQRALFMQTLLNLADAVDRRDPFAAGHTRRVTDYALMLAEELQVSAANYHHLEIGTPLHDIGKIDIDDAILRKTGRLTPTELAQVQGHPAKGVALLKSIPQLEPVLPIVGSHHEHWDGSGYPDGLIGEIIAPLARLVTIADVFDALTSDRPFRKALAADEAFGYLQRNAGSLFDPQFTQAFLRIRPRIEARLRERSLHATSARRAV